MAIELNEEQLDNAVSFGNEDYTPLPKARELTEKELSTAIDTEAEVSGFGTKEYFQDVAKSLFGAGREDVPDFTTYLKAGFQEGVIPLAVRGELPDAQVPEDSPFFQSVAKGAVTMATDLPVSAVGFLAGLPAGAAAGTAVAGPAGAPVGAAAGAFGGATGLPQGLRAAIIEAYKSGEVDTAREYWNILSAFAVDGFKGLVTGAAGGAAGKVVAGPVQQLMTRTGAAPALATKTVSAATLGAEASTMVTVGAGLEGRLPEKRDFAAVATTLLGIKAITAGATKVSKSVSDMINTTHDVYITAGKTPKDVLSDVKILPSVKEDILGSVAMPRDYRTQSPEPIKITIEKNAAEKAKAPKNEFEADRAEIRSKIKNLDEEVSKSGAGLKERIFDRLLPIKQAVEKVKGTKAEEGVNAYTRLNLLANQRVAAGDTLKFGVVDFADRGKRVSKGFEAIVKSAPDVRLLEEAMVARRVIEKEGQGINTGFNKETAERVVSKLDNRTKTAMGDLDVFQSELLRFYKDSGLLSEEDFATVQSMNKHYFPFQRVVDNLERGGTLADIGGNGLKKMVGSDRDIISPLEVIIENTHFFMDRANKNVAMRQLVSDLAGSEFVVKAADQSVTKLSKNQIAVWEQGKRSIYDLNDDMARAVESLRPQDINATVKVLGAVASLRRAGVVLDVAFGIRNAIRGELSAGINSVNNYIPFVDGVVGIYGLLSAGRGVKKLEAGKTLSKSQKRYVNLFSKFVQEGGLGGTLFDIDNAYIKTGILDVIRQSELHNTITPKNAASSMANIALRVGQSPVKALGNFAQFMENIPRFREFVKSVEKGDSPTVSAFAAREIALRFEKAGSSRTLRDLRIMNSFLGASLNALDKAGRTIVEKPLQTAARATAFVVLPTVANHLLNHYETDKNGNYRLADWYKNMPDYQRDLFHLVKIGEGDDEIIARIPRGFDISLVVSRSVETFLDKVMGEDPELFKELVGAIDASFPVTASAAIPDAFEPFLEGAMNKSLFSDAPIIPANREGLLPEMRYTPRTTEVAKSVGALIAQIPKIGETNAASPAMIDNFIKSWTGTMGMAVTKAIDDVLQNAGVIPKAPDVEPDLSDILGLSSSKFKQEIKAIDIPIVGAFIVRNPAMDAKPIQKFFELKKKSDQFEASINLLKKTDPVRALQLQRRSLTSGGGVDLSRAGEAVSKAMNKVFLIGQIPDDKLSPAEKRQTVDEIYRSLIVFTSRVNPLVEAKNAAIKEMVEEEK